MADYEIIPEVLPWASCIPDPVLGFAGCIYGKPHTLSTERITVDSHARNHLLCVCVGIRGARAHQNEDQDIGHVGGNPDGSFRRAPCSPLFFGC